jgi:Ca-activated chloride channel homolog
MVMLLQVVRGKTIVIVPLIVAALGLTPQVIVSAQFASGVNLVEVYAAVTDRRGEPIAGLTAADFRVSEDGQPQRVTTFAAGDVPLAVAVAIDRSFSMGSRLSLAKSAARAFVGALRADDRAMIVAIGSETEIAAPLTRDRASALGAVDRLDQWGTTPLYDATMAAIDAVEPAECRRALVLLSDGRDRYSSTSSSALLEHARRQDVLVYPIAMGAMRPAFFAELAAATGGRSFFARTPADLQTAMNAITRELRGQYLLGYVPTRSAADDAGWRAITVVVDRPDVVVRARDGYYARR